MDCEDKIISQLKAMRAGNVPKNEPTTTVNQVSATPSDRNQLKPHVTFEPQTQETPSEFVKVQDLITEMSKTVAEQSKTMAGTAKQNQKALAELKEHKGAAANVVQAQERYESKGKGNGRGKGDAKGQAGNGPVSLRSLCGRKRCGLQ